VREAGGTATLSVNGSYSQKPDVAIVVYGEHPYAEYQGDVPTLAFEPTGKTDLVLLKRLKAEGIPVVSVFMSGRPLFTSAEINASDAFVAAWLPGSQADGIADVLVDRGTGSPRRDFTGRLSFPWPADAHSPVKGALFPAGYGLDYEHNRTIGHLSEDPRMNVRATLNVDHFFEAGHARAPWSISVVDAGGKRPADEQLAASPAGDVTIRSVDVHAQEDAKKITWNGTGSITIDGPPADLSRQLSEGFALKLEWRIDSRPNGPVAISLDNQSLDVGAWLAAQPVGIIVNLRIPLRCFAKAGKDLSHVDNALQIAATGGFTVTLVSANVEPLGSKIDCPPSTSLG
jgi:beta-glucosidase